MAKDRDWFSMVEQKVLNIDKVEQLFTLRDKYYAMIKENYPKNEMKLMRHIAGYRDKYFGILSNPYPTAYPVFSPDDEAIVLQCCGVDKKTAIEDFVNAGIPSNINKPPTNYAVLPMLLFLLVRYYMEKKDLNRVKVLYYYIGYSYYWLIYTKYFNKFLPKEEIMAYTINNMTNKFKIKQLQSVDELIFHSVEINMEANTKRITNASNAEIYYTMNLIQNTLNNFMRTIREEYEKNYRNKDVIMTSIEVEDDEIRSLDSVSSDIEALAQSYTTQFFSTPPNNAIITYVAKQRCDKNELKAAITHIVDDGDFDTVKRFYSAVFQLYFANVEGKPNVKSINFPAVMDVIYKKGNSTDKNIVFIKDTLNKWLYEGSMVYRSTSRLATLNNFRKAIYYYFIWVVAWNN